MQLTCLFQVILKIRSFLMQLTCLFQVILKIRSYINATCLSALYKVLGQSFKSANVYEVSLQLVNNNYFGINLCSANVFNTGIW